ncbi:methyltransferase [Vibrio sp. V27_P1S3P104]|uniref:methyltransferase n=1 Tax=unclassified Vibrio TaxID=2614977 RepID=UPI0013727264|nr:MULTISPECIES: methyltransferase [unclassified Vibrio]NAW68078.1 methyltransferase [Vibrio sp. V28_P6S34P95]NAX06621.1 methyltransferase [Vibrio sp. V30_P3S12P165]NAX33702.1 methyltransferase [Vibrio sp. V29_P1S30P107]NAX38255.1 methyltransferase [Vibrio sp. V27_P1S3P104]NAX41691.1 methyltransferase [Vibrio sp. V26_P1S5P106]
MKTELTLYDQTLTLHRFPQRSNETLQAWDAGDEYLITHVASLSLPPNQHILILNDHFGALSCWFSKSHTVTVMSDSFIAHQAIKQNLMANQCPSITLTNTMGSLPSDIDLVLIQVPRNNRHLVWQLTQLRQSLSSDCPVIAVNKAKEIHTSTLQLFSQYLGQTKTSLAWKKHRLIFSYANSKHALPTSTTTCWKVENHPIELTNLPNVYSGEKLDQGARFFLNYLPSDDTLLTAIDLGCGNGVLSVKLGQLNPQVQLTCVDESFMAVESTRLNLLNNLAPGRQFECLVNNCLDGFADNSTQLIVCNPPFHQQQAITDHIAWQMFCDAKRVLNQEGKLLVIGNRHLGYDIKLKRLFGKSQVKTVASNAKFVILQAIKQ